jgi:dolichol-phosphate mannosyltransferase
MSTSAPPELMIVMPVYNEQASVRKVVLEWFAEVENWTENFVFLAIDDGSKDETPRVMKRLQQQLGERMRVVSRENRGHGQSCLEGYRIAMAEGVSWVFQIDSDGQCDPQYFFRFWRLREKCDVVYGVRKRRDDGWRRALASLVLKLTLAFACRVNCVDANVPYRLVKTSCLAKFVDRIPATFSLANIALAVLMRRDKAIRQGEVPIHFRERYGGEPSVPIRRFGAKAAELVRQLRELK